MKNTEPITVSTRAELETHRVCVPLSIVSACNPLLVIGLSHFLALLVLDLKQRELTCSIIMSVSYHDRANSLFAQLSREA